MKKITTILMLLMLTCMGAKAGVVTTWTTAGSIVTKDALVASAGSGARYAFRMPSNSQPGWCGFNSTTGKVDILDVDHLFTLENNQKGGYWLKRCSNGEYLSGNNAFSATAGIDLTLTDRVPSNVTDYDTGYSNSTPFVSFDNASGGHYNNGNSNYDFRAGTGGWSVYVTYGPFYIVTVDCQEGGTSIEGYPQTLIVTENTTIEAPTFVGKTLQGTDSYTISADQNITFNYQVASSFDYTVAINPGNPWGTVMTTTSIPAGTEVKINNNKVDDGDVVSYSAAVTETDVQVDFPTGFEYMAASVDINGADITVTCYDPRWSINFSKDQKYTRTNRFINNVRIGNKTFAITNDGLNTPAYRDFTNEVLVVPAGATLVPAIGYTGQWMHGFFYVDLNNDGTFYVQKPDTTTAANTEYNGELLSYKNEGNVLTSSSQELPAFTMPSTPGDYRARFKMDWASTDPGGNPGADINNVNSSNHIIANGGTIVDITLRILAAADVTYVVVDGDNNELFRTTEAVGIGETITTLPEAYQHSLFYEYSTVNETISGNTTLTFTATPKASAPLQFTADTSAPVWYYLKNQGNNSNPNGVYPTYVAGGNPNVTLPTTNAEDATTSWAFIGNPYSGFQIVNKAAGTNLILGSASTVNASNTGGNTYATLATAGTQAHEVWTIEASSYATNGFFIRNADGHALNLRSNDNLAYWTGGADQGSTFVATTPEEVYAALITRLQNIPFGTGLGQYSLTYQGTDYTERAAEVISDLVANGYTEQTMVEAQQMLAGASLNMPKANTFLRIKSVAQNGYVSSITGVEVDPTLAGGNYAAAFTTGGTADEASTIWLYDGEHLISYATGLYSTGYKADAVGVAAPVTYTFVAATDAMGKYWVKPSNTNYWYGGTPTLDYHSQPAGREQTRFELEEVTDLPITLKAFDGKYYATFYSPVAISDISGGCQVYGVTIKGDYAVPSALSSSGVPANCGVLLIGESASAVASVGTYEGSVTDTGLKGVVASEPAADQTGRFYLGTSSGNLGFFKVKTGGATGGFKAFVEKATGSLAKDGFDLFFGDVTGVEAIENGALGNGEMYNLQGQRVNKAQKGVYIQNGKKMVVR